MPADIAHLPTALGSVVPTASSERNVCINSTFKFIYIFFLLFFTCEHCMGTVSLP